MVKKKEEVKKPKEEKEEKNSIGEAYVKEEL